MLCDDQDTVVSAGFCTFTNGFVNNFKRVLKLMHVCWLSKAASLGSTKRCVSTGSFKVSHIQQRYKMLAVLRAKLPLALDMQVYVWPVAHSQVQRSTSHTDPVPAYGLTFVTPV